MTVREFKKEIKDNIGVKGECKIIYEGNVWIGNDEKQLNSDLNVSENSKILIIE